MNSFWTVTASLTEQISFLYTIKGKVHKRGLHS